MKPNRTHLRLLVLVLPVLAAALLAGRIHSHQATLARPSAAYVPCGTATDLHLFIKKHGKIRLANVQSYYYQAIQIPNGGAIPNASTFSTPAPLMYDIGVGDMTTGYNCPAAASGTSSGSLCVLMDLGSAQTVTKWEFAGAGFTAFPVATVILYSSNDGVTWTQQDSTFIGSTASITRTISSVTARYWMVIYENNNLSLTPTGTDTRLYDGSGTIYGPPSTPPVNYAIVGFRNSQVF